MNSMIETVWKSADPSEPHTAIRKQHSSDFYLFHHFTQDYTYRVKIKTLSSFKHSHCELKQGFTTNLWVRIRIFHTPLVQIQNSHKTGILLD